MVKKFYELKINERLEHVMPPLQEMELEILTQSLLAEGCRDPLVVWEETGELVDGHNRYRICRENNIPFAVTEISFSSLGEAIAWSIRNQIGRRNLTPFQRCEMVLPFEAELKAEAKKRQCRKSALNGNSGMTGMKTRDILADMAGVSHGSLEMVKKTLQKADMETLRRVRKGEISIHYAWKSLFPEVPFKKESEAISPRDKEHSINLFPIKEAVRSLHDRVSEGEMTTKAILAELTRVAEMIDEANRNGEKII